MVNRPDLLKTRPFLGTSLEALDGQGKLGVKSTCAATQWTFVTVDLYIRLVHSLSLYLSLYM